MPLFKVTKSHDAWVNYTTIVEAVNDEEATWIAGDRAYRGKWEEAGVHEFDAFDITAAEPFVGSA